MQIRPTSFRQLHDTLNYSVKANESVIQCLTRVLGLPLLCHINMLRRWANFLTSAFLISSLVRLLQSAWCILEGIPAQTKWTEASLHICEEPSCDNVKCLLGDVPEDLRGHSKTSRVLNMQICFPVRTSEEIVQASISRPWEITPIERFERGQVKYWIWQFIYGSVINWQLFPANGKLDL